MLPLGIAFCLPQKCWCADCIMSALLCTPISVSFLTAGGTQPSPYRSLPCSFLRNWKLFLPRVEWNIHKTYSQVGGFTSKVRHGTNLVMRFFSFLFFFKERKKERYSPIPHSEPLPVYLYVCWRPLVVTLISWAALRNRKGGSLINVSVFAFQASSGKKGPIHASPRQHAERNETSECLSPHDPVICLSDQTVTPDWFWRNFLMPWAICSLPFFSQRLLKCVWSHGFWILPTPSSSFSGGEPQRAGEWETLYARNSNATFTW